MGLLAEILPLYSTFLINSPSIRKTSSPIVEDCRPSLQVQPAAAAEVITLDSITICTASLPAALVLQAVDHHGG